MSRAISDEQAGNGKRVLARQNEGVARDNEQDESPPRPPESFGRAEHPEHKKPPLFKRPWFWVIAAVVIIGASVGGVMWWLHSRHYLSTDDAFVQAHVTNVSARVASHVNQVHVTDNQDVKQGQLLVTLDPVDFQQAIESAEAQRQVAAGQLEQANSQVVVAQASVGEAKADIASAESNATQAEEDLKRYESADRRAVSQQQVDAARAASRSTHAALEASRQKLAASEAQLILSRSQVTTAQSQLRRSEVAVEQSRTQLAYATVVAPTDGRITNRSVSVGDYVQVGQALMAIIPTHKYVIANFKETEMRDLRPDQRVQIAIDAYGTTLKGHVQSVQAGSGAAFSLLPPENATGNYVKVVQRVPVKIEFDDPPPPDLGPGMSVVPTVDIRNR